MKLSLKAELRRYGRWWPSLTLSIYRTWAGTASWCTGPTYRYIGANRRSPFKIGRHVDYRGRVYRYLGWVTVWQDIRPATKGRAKV